MNLKKNVVILLLLITILASAGCGIGGCEEESSPEESGKPAMPREINEMEEGLLEIMQLADLIPLVEIAETVQEDREEEKRTFEETLIGEVVASELNKRENNREGELPDDAENIWDGIKTAVQEIHELWNILEPALEEQRVDSYLTSSFEEELDILTGMAVNQDYTGAMTAANALTRHLPMFMAPFTDGNIPLAHELKYHTRNIVLKTAGSNRGDVQESLDYLRAKKTVIVNVADEIEGEQLEASIDNMQRAVDKDDLHLVKINASIVMSNLVDLIEGMVANQK